ncbi:MAG: family 10 glycosylhydrolase [Fimbriimonadales bacterium]|nr:family 10 glycosylhydrolase [Fimbriimonadales bacterium]
MRYRWTLTAGIALMWLTANAQAEFRGFWVDGFNAGFHTPEQVDTLLQRVRAAGMNAVIVQMRKRGDAHYDSKLEPFATQQQQGFDALAYLIQKAHSETPRIEVHVWVNSHPIWPGSSWPNDPKHILNRHPEIQTEDYDGKRITEVGYGGDWGHPLYHEWFSKVVLDIVRRYDVDGIHFDYIRYTGERWGYNPVSIERFNRRYGRIGKPDPTDPLWKQWRRDQVTAVVRKIYAQATALKPRLKVSAALITWGDGPQNSEDWVNRSAYRAVFQDWQGWLKEGILDMAIPMVYYNEASPRFAEFYRRWAGFLKDHQHGRIGVVGIGNYLNSIENTLKQVEFARQPSPAGNRVHGVNFFSYAATTGVGTEDGSNRYEEAFYRALGDYFGEWVPTPPMPWKQSPTTGHLMGTVLRADTLAPADGAVVEVYQAGSLIRTLTADGNGFFAAVHLPAGVYSLTVRAEGLPAVQVSQVWVAAGAGVNLPILLGSSEAIAVRRIESLAALPEGTPITLTGKVAAQDWLTPDAPLVLRDALSDATVSVQVGAPALPLLQGDRVAVQGVLRKGADGSLRLEQATVKWLGVL